MSEVLATDVLSRSGAPVARPVSWFSAWRAQRAGRSDAAGPTPDPVTGHLPFTLRLHAQAAEAEAAVGRVLHAQITVLDRQFVALCAQIHHHHQAMHQAGDAAARVPVDAEAGSLAAANHARESARLVRDRDGHQQAGADATARVAGLLAERRHLIDQGRALVAGHAARSAQLAACHRRGYERRARRGPAASVPPVPGYTAIAGWVDGDLPILVAAIDPDTRTVVDWAVREFDQPATAAVTGLRAV